LGHGRGGAPVRAQFFLFFFQAGDGIRDLYVTGVQTCALPILRPRLGPLHARTTPQAPAATVKRPWSRPYIAISKPWPSSPIRFSAGTSTFWKKSSPVEPAQMPSLFSVSAVVKPGIPRSRTKAEIPLCLADGSVLANT